GISGDFNPLHTDELFVRERTPFRGRIAHGLLVLAISSGLQSELDRVESVAYLEAQREFVAPTYPGDTIQATWKVEGSRPSRSRPSRMRSGGEGDRRSRWSTTSPAAGRGRPSSREPRPSSGRWTSWSTTPGSPGTAPCSR